MTNHQTILDEIRRVRHVISKEIGHDPRRITEYYANLQRALGKQVVNLSGESESGRTTKRTRGPDKAVSDDTSSSAAR